MSDAVVARIVTVPGAYVETNRVRFEIEQPPAYGSLQRVFRSLHQGTPELQASNALCELGRELGWRVLVVHEQGRPRRVEVSL